MCIDQKSKQTNQNASFAVMFARRASEAIESYRPTGESYAIAFKRSDASGVHSRVATHVRLPPYQWSFCYYRSFIYKLNDLYACRMASNASLPSQTLSLFIIRKRRHTCARTATHLETDSYKTALYSNTHQ